MKHNLFKRTASLVLAFAMGAMLFTGCGGAASSTPASTAGSTPASQTDSGTGEVEMKPYVIGIAEAQANDEVTTRRAYLEKFIGPTYNVKFIFSEVLTDDAATKTFIENCIDSGADAIIDFKSASGQMARLCEENGLVYTINGTYEQHPEFLEDEYPMFAGCVGSNNEQVASLFGDWLSENASEDGSEGFLLSTSLAAQGNTQHVEITRALLEGLAAKYDLTYEKEIDELIASAETTNVANSKDLLITLYPGSPNKETWLPGISSLIQTGNYGMVLSSGQTYNQSATVINEVEQSLGIDIKVASVGALGSTLTTAFNTLDPNGNPSVDLITVKSVSSLTACLFATTYNALNGDMDATLIDGKPARFSFNFIGIPNPEQLAQMEGWDDRDAGNWIAGKEAVDSMLTIYNPDLTADGINAYMNSLDFETIQGMMG